MADQTPLGILVIGSTTGVVRELDLGPTISAELSVVNQILQGYFEMGPTTDVVSSMAALTPLGELVLRPTTSA